MSLLCSQAMQRKYRNDSQSSIGLELQGDILIDRSM